MDKLLENNLAVKIISVLVAIVLWFQVSGQGLGSQVQRVVHGVPVSWRATPSDLSVAAVDPQQVSVTVLGNPTTVDALTGADFAAVANLNKAQPGRQSFYVDITVPRGVSVLSVEPANVAVVLASIIEHEATIAVITSGTPATGYRAGTPTASPQQAIIRGTVAELAGVERVLTTVQVGGATSAVHAQVTPEAVDAQGKPVPGVQILPQKVAVTVPITHVLPTASVPVSVATSGQPAAGYTVTGMTANPANVSVAAPQSVLSALGNIETQSVDISGAKANVTAQEPLVLPSGVTSATPAVVSVDVHVALKKAKG